MDIVPPAAPCGTTAIASCSSTACQLLPSFPPPERSSTAVFCVDANGCCNFTTVQAALDAVPPNSQKRSIVWINSGIYFKQVTVKKPNVTFQGQGLKATTIVWNDTANSAHGTPESASVHIDAPGFVAKKLASSKPPAPKPGAVGAQAVAIRINGDEAAFWGCGFFGAQDTLLDDQFRHYFKECFIQGGIDFIFGDGRSLYENCTLNSIAEELPKGQGSINGAITAQGSGNILLRRAWQAYSRVVFAYTYMPAIVASAGWGNWGQESRKQEPVFNSFSRTVAFARNLDASYIDGHEWLKPFDDALFA
ncbi:hypothetical protein GQ55_1G345100 [Panicum hallii var. hallii]|uniref:pectinesterase n=1 Tax=Panicum hallii var. hallii TaxID=1504633 RepID=A0A2T7FAL1_9POAL|nr:hypothetical protein GQ55_1G345100 [Panicum hallii var. hallii]